MNLLTYILIFNLIGSIISLFGGLLLLINKNFTHKYAHFFSSYAAGALLATALFDLIPEALEQSEEAHNTPLVFIFILLGILFFFLLERFLHWYHHHGFTDHQVERGPVISLLIVGDTIHNFIDGVAIAATFIVSVPLGIITTFAVGAHEIPQEIGDFGVMIKHGFSRKKAIIINSISALASFLGAVLAFYFGSTVEGLTVIFLSITSGFFLYISLSDLIPEIHHENKKNLAIWETFYLFLGVATIYFALFFIKEILHITP